MTKLYFGTGLPICQRSYHVASTSTENRKKHLIYGKLEMWGHCPELSPSQHLIWPPLSSSSLLTLYQVHLKLFGIATLTPPHSSYNGLNGGFPKDMSIS